MTKNTLHGQISSLGINENEAELYIKMLEYQKVTVGELQKVTKFSRTLLYHQLNNLVSTGLVKVVDGAGKKTYSPVSPDVIYELLAENEEKFKKTQKKIKSLVPDLQTIYRQSQSKSSLRQTFGIDAYKQLMMDILESQPKTLKSVGFFSNKKRPGLKIRDKFLQSLKDHRIVHEALLHEDEQKQNLPPGRLCEARILPSEFFDEGTEMYIYSWKVAFVSFVDRQPHITIFQDERFYKSMLQFISYSWNSSKKIS